MSTVETPVLGTAPAPAPVPGSDFFRETIEFEEEKENPTEEQPQR